MKRLDDDDEDEGRRQTCWDDDEGVRNEGEKKKRLREENESCVDDGDDDEEAKYYATERAAGFAKALVASFVSTRHAYVSAARGRVVGLDILTIDPAWQRRGNRRPRAVPSPASAAPSRRTG